MREVSSPEKKTFVNGPLIREKIVTGRTTKIEKGHPRITPAAATETAAAYFSKRKSAEESVTAYMEKLLGRKPIKKESNNFLIASNFLFQKFDGT